MEFIIYFACQSESDHLTFQTNQNVPMWVKIGYSTPHGIINRMRVNNVGNPNTITIYNRVIVRNHSVAEGFLKGILSDNRQPRKEWFRLTKAQCDSAILRLQEFEIEQEIAFNDIHNNDSDEE